LYKIQKSKDSFALFKVYFDSLAEIDQSPLALNEKCEAKPPLPGGLFPVALPSGKIHLGWPSRVDSADQMVDDFKRFSERKEAAHLDAS